MKTKEQVVRMLNVVADKLKDFPATDFSDRELNDIGFYSARIHWMVREYRERKRVAEQK